VGNNRCIKEDNEFISQRYSCFADLKPEEACSKQINPGVSPAFLFLSTVNHKLKELASRTILNFWCSLVAMQKFDLH
jgi:hypothetical protein